MTPMMMRRRAGEWVRMTRLGLPSELRMAEKRGPAALSVYRRGRRARRIQRVGGRFRPPGRMRRRPIRKGDRRQLSQRTHVNRSLEINDLTHRLPEIDPAVIIELGL